MNDFEIKKTIIINNIAIVIAILGYLSCYLRFHGHFILLCTQIIIGVMITISLKSITNQIVRKRIIQFWVVTIIYLIAHAIIYLKTKNYISVWTNDFLSSLLLSIIPIYISYYFTKTLYMLKQKSL